MNLIGKILTALIALFSVLFLAFALITYATHKNWQKAYNDSQKALSAANSKAASLESEKQKVEQDLIAQQKARDENEAKLTQQLKASEAKLAETSTQLAATLEREREANAALKVAKQNMESADAHAKKLAAEKLAAEKSRDLAWDRVVKLTDQLTQLTNQFKDVQRTNLTLVEDTKNYKRVLDKFGHTADPAVYLNVAPPVEGHVTAVSDSGSGMIEVNIGSDVGLTKGHQLEVYRLVAGSGSYLGRVEVVSTDINKAVCRVLPTYQKGTIQKGDNVAARLQ